MNTPSAWRINMNDLRLQPYFEEFKNPLPDYVLIIDETIRDNSSNSFENSWLMEKIISEKYTEQKTECGVLYAKPFVQTLFSKNNELSSHRFCLQSVCYQTCFVNFIRSFVAQPLMNPFTIEELYKFPETFSQFLCA